MKSHIGMVLPLVTALASTAAAAERVSLGPSVIQLSTFEKKVERGILTPVPIELELPGELEAARVLVHYRIHGSNAWTTLELRRRGSKWDGAIPCLEVSTITGDVRFYVRIHDVRGEVIAFSGSRHDPYRVAIVHDSLRAPDAADGARCPDPSDCPPGLPGCPSEKVEKVPCRSDSDCEGEMSCGWDGFCELDQRRKHWFELSVASGLGVIGANGVCSIPSQEESGYACYRERDGELYKGNPVYRNEPLAVGRVPLRIVLGYEHLLHYQNSVALRAGYAFLGSGPTSPGGTAFVPYSAELRVTHYFAEDPFAELGLTGYAFVSGGYGMYDVKTRIHVRENPERRGAQGGNDLEQRLEVWKRAGDGFAAIGGGARWFLSRGTAVSGELGAVGVFPFSALVLSAELGVRTGF